MDAPAPVDHCLLPHAAVGTSSFRSRSGLKQRKDVLERFSFPKNMLGELPGRGSRDCNIILSKKRSFGTSSCLSSLSPPHLDLPSTREANVLSAQKAFLFSISVLYYCIIPGP